MVSYARRQQVRRLRQATSRGALAAVALAAAVLVAAAGELGLSLALLVLAGGLAAASRRAVHLAARSRVGADRRRTCGGRLSGWSATDGRFDTPSTGRAAGISTMSSGLRPGWRL